MNVYIVTWSDHYYPMGGTSDWRSVHTNLDDANKAFAAVVDGQREHWTGLANGQACLIAVNAEDGSYFEVKTESA